MTTPQSDPTFVGARNRGRRQDVVSSSILWICESGSSIRLSRLPLERELESTSPTGCSALSFRPMQAALQKATPGRQAGLYKPDRRDQPDHHAGNLCRGSPGISVVLYQVWLFIAPGLYKHERRAVTGFIFFSSFLFLAGISFGYFVMLPRLHAHFLIGFQGPFRPLISINEYFDFYFDSFAWAGRHL